jgi:hypothetical protein
LQSSARSPASRAIARLEGDDADLEGRRDPVLITSDTQIDKLEKNGTLSEKASSIRLNCPIVAVGKAT